MVGGFNTNIRYRGRIFHVQTEDSGPAIPTIVTLLYEGGAILYSRKQSYGDQVAAENVEQLVRERMEQQHREVVQGLKSGAHDELLGIQTAAAEKTVPAPAAPSAEEVQEFGGGVITARPLDEVILQHLGQG